MAYELIRHSIIGDINQFAINKKKSLELSTLILFMHHYKNIHKALSSIQIFRHLLKLFVIFILIDILNWGKDTQIHTKSSLF